MVPTINTYEDIQNLLISQDKCLVLNNPTLLDGYAIIRVGKNRMPQRLHRVVYTFLKGEIPKGLCICHSCDNRRCGNIDHLWLGTHTDNMQDMKKKGRLKLPDTKGSKHGLSKLTEENVIKIRQLLKIGMLKVDIGKMFNVNRTTIHKIAIRIRWKHI